MITINIVKHRSVVRQFVGDDYRQYDVIRKYEGDAESWQATVLLVGDFDGWDMADIRAEFHLEGHHGGAGGTFCRGAKLLRRTSKYLLFSQSGGLAL